MRLKDLKWICEEKRKLIFHFVFVLTVIVGMSFSSAKTLFAAPGDLDPTFGTGGRVTTSIRNYIAEYASAVAVQPDGKIVVAGSSGDGFTASDYDFAVVRYNQNGTLDPTFGNNGKITTPVSNSLDFANSVVIQPDGKIIVAGIVLPLGRNSDFGLVRYNSNGTLDTTFDGDGKVITPVSESPDPATAVTIQPDGKIIVVGACRGSADPQDIAVVRYNSDGSLDSTFDGDGIAVSNLGAGADYAHSVNVQADGKIVVGGTGGEGFNLKPAVARYNPNGSLDASFGSGGIVVIQTLSQPAELFETAIQPDGKIIGTGIAQTIPNSSILTVRFNNNGSLDPAFDTDGIAVTTIPSRSGDARSIAVQNNGKIVVAGGSEANGNFDFTAVRYNSDGSLDGGFGSGGFVFTPFTTASNDSVAALAIQQDGKILLAGGTEQNFRSTFAVARYQGDAVNTPRTRFDFDGDGKTDVGVFRPSNQVWYVNRSANGGLLAAQFGASTDKLVPADYDGDGKSDLAVWRESSAASFYILNSSNNTVTARQFGQTGDSPRVVGDWDGDGRADLAVYRDGAATGAQSYVFYLPSASPTTNLISIPWGMAGDEPLRGDFDGDGKFDAAVYRAATNSWYVRQSSSGAVIYAQWGVSTDKRIDGDFDGDGKTDLAVYRNGLWAILQSSNNQQRYFNWGLAADQITPGDYDGDGRTDFAVFRPGTGVWTILSSASGSVQYAQFGADGDKAVPSAFVP